LVTRVVALLLGNREASYILGGTLVSLVSFVFALAYLYRLAREALDDEQAVAALWFLAAYPFALFYGAIYTESLYLLGAAGAFYHFRRAQFVRAGLWGLLVGLTRPNGFCLTLSLGLIAIEPWLPRRIVGGSLMTTQRQPAHAIGPALAAAAMPTIGMLLYSAFVWSLTGHPFTWAAGQVAWGRHYQGLYRLVTDRYNFIGHAGLTAY